ncbi:hypothetical protein AB1L07_02285 [Niallia alba]|uniref:hypothetical protein n=1 Tax=Niallia alba TaxID=2729105 RepID=UPI0039A271EF
MSELAINNVESFLDNENVRNKYIHKVEVLEKVKELITLPNTEIFTSKQVADWYEVSDDTLRQLFVRNKEELLVNGAVTISGKELRDIKSLSGLKTRAGSITVYSKRAMLNVGMLLRDSEIAIRVRKTLLDQQEQMSDEQKVVGLDKEKMLVMDIIFADSEEDKMLALGSYRKYKNEHITKLEKQINEQKPVVDAWGTFKDSNNTYSFEEAAKMIATRASENGKSIKITKVTLPKFLREQGGIK